MRYKALALQTLCQAINHCTSSEDAIVQILINIDRIRKQIIASKKFIGSDLKLVVLPEYFATGFPMQESLNGWLNKACFSFDDDIFTSIAKIASESEIYLSGNLYEKDSAFPEIYFQSSFIVNPSGQLILKYRRLNSMFAVTPYDVLDRYLEVYGKESLFPVIETEIGVLACIASEEILYPEIARCLMMRGAEIFCHNTSEICSPLWTQKNIAKQARAIENMAYVVSANSAGIVGTDFPSNSTDSHSKIINYEGNIMVESGQGETMVANATIDIDALRAHRQRPGMSNYISRQRNELFADSYLNHTFYPANLWKSDFDKSDFIKHQMDVIKNIFKQS
jgi:predicted amidohydrolase